MTNTNSLYKPEDEEDIEPFTEQIEASEEDAIGRPLVPWAGLGMHFEDNPTSAQAIARSSLGWQVEKQEVQIPSGKKVRNNFCVVKMPYQSNDEIDLGMVGTSHILIPNEAAFRFFDSIRDEGVEIKAAGELYEGRKVWMIAKLSDQFTVCGEPFSAYMIAINAHDGSSSMMVASLEVREACQSVVNMQIPGHKRSWSVSHFRGAQEKVDSGKQGLEMIRARLSSYKKYAEHMSNCPLFDEEIYELIEQIVPNPKNTKAKIKCRNVEVKREQILGILDRRGMDRRKIGEPLQNAWSFVLAVADVATHSEPVRRTEIVDERRLEVVTNGHKLLDLAVLGVRTDALIESSC